VLRFASTPMAVYEFSPLATKTQTGESRGCTSIHTKSHAAQIFFNLIPRLLLFPFSSSCLRTRRRMGARRCERSLQQGP
jgi:hypothetical protein